MTTFIFMRRSFYFANKSMPLFEFEGNDTHRRHLDSEFAF